MKSNRAHTFLLGVTILCPALMMAQSYPASPTTPAQPNQSMPPSSANNMPDSSPNAGDVGQAMKDKMFLRKAAQGGMAEVQFGQLAAQKASGDDVKAFGQKMVDDHTKLNQTMAPIADSMGVRVPKNLSKADQAELDKLNGLSGSDFDTEYLTAMVKDHHKDLREFRQEAATAADPTLRDAVTSGEKVIREHTQMVDKLAREKGIAMPQRGANRPAPSPTM